MIKKERKDLRGLTNRIFLGGFCQGSTVVLKNFLTSNIKLGGLILCSGALLTKQNWPEIDIEAKQKVPVLCYNGKEDKQIS